MDRSWARNQTAVAAAVFVGSAGLTLVMPFLPLYFQQLGVSDVGEVALWSGVTLGVTPAITALCAPFWGRIGDRFGQKLLVQRSLFSFVIVFVAMAYVTEPWHMLALRAAQGLFAGYGTLALAMAASSAPPGKMAVAIGTVQTTQRMGRALGPIIGGVLAPLFGLRNSFVVAAVFCAAAFLMLTVLYVEAPRAAHESDAEKRSSFASILSLENLMLLMLVIFGLQVVERSFGPVLPLYVGQLGYASEDIPLITGALFSTMAFAGAFGNQVAAFLLRRMTARTIIATTSLAAAATLGVFMLVSSAWLMAVFMAAIALCTGAATTTAYTAAGGVIPRSVHATGFGFLTTASLAGLAISPVLSGLMGARNIRVVFGAGIVTLVALAVLVRRLMVERQLPVQPAPAVEEG